VYDSCSGSICPHAGTATNSSQYLPYFTSGSQCLLNASTYTCTSDTDNAFAPTSLTLQSPASTPSTVRRPVVRISGTQGMSQGFMAKLYKNSTCTDIVGTATVNSSGYADVTSESLSDGSYVFYAAVMNSAAIDSPCSTASLAYVVSNAAASVATLSYDTATPNTDSTPSFTVTHNSGSFVVDEILALYPTSNCTGTVVSNNLVPGAVASTAIVRSAAMNEEQLAYSVKITTSSGNTSCTNSINYRYDSTAPAWSGGPTIAAGDNPFNQTAVTPAITYPTDASDAGSGVSLYQYAIGTSPSDTSVVNWTTAPASPFSVSSLSLSNGGLYYLSMRAKDNVNLYSAVSSISWVVDTSAPSVSLTVAAAYPTNGAKWMDYVKNDGADIYSATDTACAGTETSLTACMHAGMMRKVPVTGETSCGNLMARDSLGVFEWTCQVKAGTATFFSTGFKAGKSLKDHIDFTVPAFKENKIIITGGVASTTYESTLATWWTNTVANLPDNSAVTTAGIVLDGTDNDTTGPDQVFTSGTIFTVENSRTTAGFQLGMDKLGLVIKQGSTLSWNNNTAYSTGSCWQRYVVCIYNQKYTWLEGSFSGGVSTNKAYIPVYLYGAKFNGGADISATAATFYGIYFSNSSYNTYRNITANSNSGTGLYLYTSAYNKFGNITANNNASPDWQHGGLYLSTNSDGNIFGEITASNNNYYGVYFYSTASDNMQMGNITVSSNGNTGIVFNGSGGSYGNITATSNGHHGIYLEATSNSTFGNIVANSNSKSGLHLYTSSGNTFGTITANSNLSPDWQYGGLYLSTNCDNNIFGNVTTSNNTNYGIYFYSTASDNVQMGNITANSNGNMGVSLNGNANTFGNITANSNGLHGLYPAVVTNSTFGNIETNSNGQSGTHLYASTGNTFGNITSNSNLSPNSQYGGLYLSTNCDNNTFGNVTTSGNYHNVYAYSTASDNLTFGNITASNSVGSGVILNGTGHTVGNIVSKYSTAANSYGLYLSGTANSTFGNVTVAGTEGSGIYVDGATNNMSFGHVISNNSRQSNGAGLHWTPSQCNNLSFRSITSNGNAYRGTMFYCTANNLNIKEYLISQYNGYDGFYIYAGARAILNHVILTNNGYYGFANMGSSYMTLRNSFIANNTHYGLDVRAGYNHFHNLIVRQNGGWGIQFYLSNYNKITGTLVSEANTSGNCYQSGGTNPGLVHSTCSSTGANGSSTYNAGDTSTAVFRTGYSNLSSSFVGAIPAPGDDTNAGDGDVGEGTGISAYSNTLDFYNFDSIFRSWGKVSGSSNPLNTTNVGTCNGTDSCRIWDWTLSQNDTLLLNRSGNGSNINNGASLSTNGSYSTGDSAFTAGDDCPVQVLGDQYLESQPFAYDATAPAAFMNNAFQSAGSSSACTSGTSCVHRFLKNATEIIADSVGDDDGLCEDNEDCRFDPNMGVYQGHAASNDPNPEINVPAKQCTWSANGGLMSGIKIYGYPKNGR